MKISLSGWIQSIKNDLYDLEKIINEIRGDYKGDLFDDLQEKKQRANKRAIGFMEDMNNIFLDFKNLKTDKEKIEWINDIEKVFCLEDLKYIKSKRTLLKRTKCNRRNNEADNI